MANQELKQQATTLTEQVSQMQEISYKTRNDCTKLKQKLTQSENEIGSLRIMCSEFQSQVESMTEDKRRTEGDVVAQI